MVFLPPVKIGLVARFIAVLAGRYGYRSDMRAVGLRSLEERHVTERSRFGKRIEEIPEHPVVGFDLICIVPTVDQRGLFVERGIYEVGCVGVLQGELPALRSVPKVDRDRPPPASRQGSSRGGDDFKSDPREFRNGG
jgi:hypothetical protein